MKRVLVIGSNSFSGSDFIDHLLERGGYEILGVSRSLEKSALFLPYKKRNSSLFRFEKVDLNHDFEKLERLIDDFQAPYIVNFAAQSEVAPSWENPHHWFQTNAVAITRLAMMLCKKKFLKNYVHISSPEVYGTCVGNVTEATSLNPSTPYAASKAAGDLSLFTFFKNFQLPLTMIRGTNVYGAHQQLFKIIPRSIIYLKKEKEIELHGGGAAIKSYIHIRDVSRGEELVMLQGKIGEIYHISQDEGVSVRNVVQTICHLLKKDFASSTKIVAERLGQDKAYVIDSTKIRKTLGWLPQISLMQGIQQCAEWVDASWHEIAAEPLAYIHKE